MALSVCSWRLCGYFGRSSRAGNHVIVALIAERLVKTVSIEHARSNKVTRRSSQRVIPLSLIHEWVQGID
jgi:hypothetical protein